MPRKAKSGEQPCPACREPCSVHASICPHCRTTFTQAQIDQRQQIEKTAKTAGLLGCGGLIVLFAIIGQCSSSSDKDDTGTKTAAVKGSAVAKSSGDAKAEIVALYKSVIATTAGCDAAMSTMGDAAQAGNLVTAYRAADRAESACLGTGPELRRLEVPDSITGENAETVEKSLEACDTAYVMKWSGAGKFKEIIDGDSSPSAMAELEENTELMQAGQMLCVGGLISVATNLGATEADLGMK